MKIIGLISVSIMMAAASVQAQDNPGSGSKATNLSLLLTSVSNILSSTNPKTVDYPNLETAAGTPQVAEDKITSNLPVPPPAQVPIVEPEPTIKISEDGKINKLSPETKRVLRSTHSGFGGKAEGKGEKITLKRGEFDPEFGSLLDGPIDKLENSETANVKVAPVAPVKPRFEITVEETKYTQSANELLEKALRAINSGQYESAIASYKLVLKRDNRNRDAMFGLAASYQKAGQRAQAREAYAKLLAAYPDFEEGFSNLLLLASEEAPADALKELDSLSARSPNFAPIYVQKAKIYAKTGDNENAKKNFIKALNIQPNNMNFRYDMAVFLDQTGDIAGASRLYSQLIDESYKGGKLPVDRAQLQERLAYIASLPQKSSL